MYIIFKTIRHKLIASCKINHSIFNYKLMRPVSNLRLKNKKPKEQIPTEQKKTRKNSKFKKRIEREKCRRR